MQSKILISKKKKKKKKKTLKKTYPFVVKVYSLPA